MSDTKKIPLIASEITGLWKAYMISTMVRCDDEILSKPRRM